MKASMDLREVRKAKGQHGVKFLKPSSKTDDSQSIRSSHGDSGGYIRFAFRKIVAANSKPACCSLTNSPFQLDGSNFMRNPFANCRHSCAKEMSCDFAAGGMGFKLLPPERGNLHAEKRQPKISLSTKDSQHQGTIPGIS